MTKLHANDCIDFYVKQEWYIKQFCVPYDIIYVNDYDRVHNVM